MRVVSMVLAQGPGQPDGDLEDRLELHVLLTPAGHLDSAAWAAGSVPWCGRQTRPGGQIRISELVKTCGGWALRELSGDDAPLHSMVVVIVRPGELVSVSQPDGAVMVYRIVAVAAE